MTAYVKVPVYLYDKYVINCKESTRAAHSLEVTK
jgi:hypothetical protein